MTGRNTELDDFLQVLRKRFVSADRSDAAEISAALRAADVLDLARETAGLDDAVDWLVGTVRTIARFSASAAFALGSRFAAQRCRGELDAVGIDTADLTSAVVNPMAHAPWTATVPTLSAPRAVVFLDRLAGSVAVVRWDSLAVEDAEGVRRTGLHEAALRTVRPKGRVTTLPETTAREVARDWDLFTTAVALGLAEQALSEAETYAGERRQFGSPISTFAGLRAMLAEMHIRVCAVRATLDRGVAADLDTAEVLAGAGRTAVDVCLDAIQVHGGYGYIDEYLVAGLLRDAVSIRARGGGRRALAAQIAARRLGAGRA